jgi:site-specific DNA recombinase
VINPAEAETVRHIFALYRGHGCVRRVKDEADRLGLRTKRIRTANGAERGGTSFSRGHIYRLLSNPIYLGQIAHKGQLYPGQHPALIDDETWTVVRDRLAANAGDHRRRSNAAEPSLLAGLLVDAHGERLRPSHAVKNSRRYRYYVSAAPTPEAPKDHTQRWRLVAQGIEDCVVTILVDTLISPAKLVELLDICDTPGDQLRRLLGRAARFAAMLRSSTEERAKIVSELVEQVIVDEKKIIIKMSLGALLGGDGPSIRSADPSARTVERLRDAVAGCVRPQIAGLLRLRLWSFDFLRGPGDARLLSWRFCASLNASVLLRDIPARVVCQHRNCDQTDHSATHDIKGNRKARSKGGKQRRSDKRRRAASDDRG